ncbi:MAG: ABC transporter permease, partial [Cytophagales bacterium]
INLLEAPLLATILAFIIKYKSAPGGKEYIFRFNDNFPAFLLMSIIVALFMGLTVSAEEIIRDRKILKRESFLNLSWNSYLVSKLSILFLISAIQTLTFVIIGNLILEIHGMTLAFWFVLFTTSCFANVLGLNISSAFNSAVTVYVMIPLLLIPQMILSGLLFSFDKLNNLISTKGKVPFVADMMASRWAYEALATHQFINNDYENRFYDFHKNEAKADFKAAYLTNELKKANSYALQNFESKNDSIKKMVASRLQILVDNLKDEPFKSGADKIDFNREWIAENYTKIMGGLIDQYLEEYKKNYQKIYNENVDVIEKKITWIEKRGENINYLKNRYYNESLADLVKNINSGQRIMEYNGKLIQQINPIFQDPQPNHLADYRTAFFLPAKNFMGSTLSTYWFNTLVIWLMAVFFYVCLYFEWLKKLVESLSKVDILSKAVISFKRK